MRTVIYHGSLSPPSQAPDSVYLASTEARPGLLSQRLAHAEQLVILDPMSFPYELMTDDHRDIPVVVRLPDREDDDVLHLALGDPLLSRLTPFDVLVVGDVAGRAALCQRYRIGRSRVVAASSADWLSAVVGRSELMEAAASDLRRLGHDPSVWNLPSRQDKATYRVQDRTFTSIFSERPDLLFPNREVRVLLVGHVPTRLLSLLPEGLFHSASVLDASTLGIGLRAVDWPAVKAQTLGRRLRIPFGSQHFDVVIVSWLYSRAPRRDWTLVTEELVRVARPGGLFVILDQFVPRQPDTPALSLHDMMNFLSETHVFSLAVRELYSLTYPHDSGPSDGALVLAPLGRFQRR